MSSTTLTSDTLRQLSLLRIRSKRAYMGAREGGHISLRRGHGIEFADYRKYELGDDPRHIDWGVYGRSERLYVKQFREERDLSAYFFLDGSASMRVPSNDRKWHHGCQIALALAYILSQQQDRVSLCVPGAATSPLFRGAKTIRRLESFLSTLDAEVTLEEDSLEPKSGNNDFVRDALKEVGRINFPGIAIVVSDFLMPPEDVRVLFDRLRAKNLDITAIQILGAHDRNPFAEGESYQAIDSESGHEFGVLVDSSSLEKYEAMLAEHQSTLQRYFLRASIPLVQARPEQDLLSFLTSELVPTGLLV